MQRVYCFLYAIYIFFQIRLDHFAPMSVLFVQQPKTEKNILEILPVLGMDVQGTIIVQISLTFLL